MRFIILVIVIFFVMLVACSKMSDQDFEKRVRIVLEKIEKERNLGGMNSDGIDTTVTQVGTRENRVARNMPTDDPVTPLDFYIAEMKKKGINLHREENQGPVELREEIMKRLSNNPDYLSKKKEFYEYKGNLYFGQKPTASEFEAMKKLHQLASPSHD